MAIKWRYLPALGAIALLTIGSQYFLHALIDEQQSDAQIINLAGRQRMLSQKITKAASHSLLLEHEADRKAARRELETSLDTWLEAHHTLQYGSDSLNVAHLNTYVIRNGFTKIRAPFISMQEAAREVLHADSVQARAALSQIIMHEGRFLRGMDQIVKDYESIAISRVDALRKGEMIIGVVTLFVLLLELFFVFRPAEVRIKEYVNELTNSSVLLDAQNHVLEMALRDAEQSARAKSTFLSTMSHEIRTPLNGIIGMSSLLKETPLNEEQKDLASVIDSSGAHLLTLINDVLDFSKMDAGQLELDLHAFELAPFLESIITPFNVLADHKKVEFRVDIDENVPAHFIADSKRIRQILINLVGNAKKFTQVGTIGVSVKQAYYRPSDSGYDTCGLTFSVSDTGIGIPLDKQSNLFDAFTQVDASISRKYGGTGLGLAICKQLTELMGGRIWFESRPGGGSVFNFSLELDVPVEGPLNEIKEHYA